MPPTTAHQMEQIEVLLIINFDTLLQHIQLFFIASNTIFQRPIHSPTRAQITIIIALCWGLIAQHGLGETQSRPMHEDSQKSDNVRSHQGSADTPVQLVHLLDFFGCWWYARQVDQRRHETAWSNQEYLWERNEGYYRTRCAQPGTIWTRVLPCVHASGRQVKDFKLTPWSQEGKRSYTVQPDGSVFPGRRPHWMDQHQHKAMPSKTGPYKGQLWWVHQGLPQGSCQAPKCWQLANLFALHCQKACFHANAWIHAASIIAPQLPWQWLTSVKQWSCPQRKRRSNKSSRAA